MPINVLCPVATDPTATHRDTAVVTHRQTAVETL